MDSESARLRFSDTYCEDVTLPEGTVLRFRTLLPDDRTQISKGFLRLSSRSRYLRFLSPKRMLTEDELRFLTELDGINHYGIVVLRLDDAGLEGEGVAVGRFIRSEEDQLVAEPAVTVVDEMQNRGIGTLLCSKLALAAQERGILRFRCHIHSENLRGQEMIRHAFPHVHFRAHGETVIAEFPVSSEEPLPCQMFGGGDRSE